MGGLLIIMTLFAPQGLAGLTTSLRMGLTRRAQHDE